MRPLSAVELLGVWEQGLAQTPAQRALTLLAVACPEASLNALAELSIGQRDARLLTLRERTFGTKVVSLATCSSCGERLELTFDVANIRVEPETEPAETLSLTDDGYEVQFRLPNSLDLAAISGHGEDADVSRDLLLERCLVAARHGDKPASADQLPTDVVNAVVEQMAQVDPQADVQLKLTCPACDHQWQVIFDIASFFWSEIDAWAYRVLREVHTLASAYGWREADTLAMSPWRRQLYLEMVSR